MPRSGRGFSSRGILLFAVSASMLRSGLCRGALRRSCLRHGGRSPFLVCGCLHGDGSIRLRCGCLRRGGCLGIARRCLRMDGSPGLFRACLRRRNNSLCMQCCFIFLQIKSRRGSSGSS